MNTLHGDRFGRYLSVNTCRHLGGGGMRFRRGLYYMISYIDVKALIPLMGRKMIDIASLKYI